MSLFSFLKRQPPPAESVPTPEPEAQSALEEPQPPAPAPWAMTEQQYDALIKNLDYIAENVIIVNDNVRLAIRKLDTLQSDMGVSINNELILGRDQDKLIDSVRVVQHTLNRVERTLDNLSK